MWLILWEVSCNNQDRTWEEMDLLKNYIRDRVKGIGDYSDVESKGKKSKIKILFRGMGSWVSILCPWDRKHCPSSLFSDSIFVNLLTSIFNPKVNTHGTFLVIHDCAQSSEKFELTDSITTSHLRWVKMMLLSCFSSHTINRVFLWCI